MRKLIAAIDFGTSKTVCLVGEKDEDGIKIISYKQISSKGIKRGEIINIQYVLDTIVPAIKGVENSMGLKINEAFVGISGRNIKCLPASNRTTRNNPEELISQDEVNSLTSDMFNTPIQNGERILHVIPQSFNIDDYMGITEPIGMIGKEISANYNLLIGKNNSAQSLKNVMQRTGIKLHDLILAPIASAYSALTIEEKEIGAALVDIGAGTTELTIITDNIIRYSSVIPFGGNSVTDDICRGCGISLKQAEEMKKDFGSCMSSLPSNNQTIKLNGGTGSEDKEIAGKFLSKIIEARMMEIFEAVDYEIERSNYKSKLNAGIVITGGTSKMLHITKLASMITGLKAKLSTPSFSVTADSVEDIQTPEASTAVGLILYGFDNINTDKLVAPFVGELQNTDLFTKEESDSTIEEQQEKEKEKEKEEKERQEKEQQEKTAKKNKFSFKKILSSFNNDNIFKQDNQA